MSKKGAETFADRLYAESFDVNSMIIRNGGDLRRKLFGARRFVLDPKMSAFLADLATATFLRKGRKIIILKDIRAGRDDIFGELMPASRHSNKLIDQIRIGARLPHPLTWIEYDFRATLMRNAVICGYDSSLMIDKSGPVTEGWLFEQHPTIDTAFTASVFVLMPTFDPPMSVFPWQYHWMADDRPLPFPAKDMLESDLTLCEPRPPGMEHITITDTTVSETICGLQHYHSQQVNAGYSPYDNFTRLVARQDPKEALLKMMQALTQWSGIVRRMWSLLATVNDIPVLAREVKPSRGFVARGAYRRFLTHKTITLHVPIKKDLRTLARHVVACARRRAHMVRGHWRLDWRAPPNPMCEHEYRDTDQVCKRCQGHRLWIKEYQRGDSSLGVVMTDYEVVHE